MKIYNHDEKHGRVNGELDLGNLSVDQLDVLQKVICFLQDQEVSSRYHSIVLADNYSIYYDEEDGESNVIWENVQ